MATTTSAIKLQTSNNLVESDNSAKSGDSFIDYYNQFVADFDKITADLFQGPKLEGLAKEFLSNHSDYLENSSELYTVAHCKFPNCNFNETIEEDLKILRANEESNWPKVSDEAKMLANVYWRASQACYLRITLNKSRLNQEDNRSEAVDFARRAIRLDPKDFMPNYWYMITLGWELNETNNPKDRTMLARNFRQATLRCIQLNPSDALAHNLLGRYYYNVAGLNWLERTVAKSITGEKFDGTYADAEREFMAAHKLRDDWLPTGLWMARALLGQKRPINEVRTWIESALEMDCREPSTEIERAELLELHKKLKLSNN